MKDVKARDIMSKAVHHVSPQLHLVDLESELSSHRISGAPVVNENGEVVGVITIRDLLSDERDERDWKDGFEDGQRLLFEIALARRIEPGSLPDPLDEPGQVEDHRHPMVRVGRIELLPHHLAGHLAMPGQGVEPAHHQEEQPGFGRLRGEAAGRVPGAVFDEGVEDRHEHGRNYY